MHPKLIGIIFHEPDDMSYSICETCRNKGEKKVEKKTCSTCGCETSNYEVIHSAIICDECEQAMVLVDKKFILSDGKNFWFQCQNCGNTGPFRPSPKEAMLAAKEEFALDGSECVFCGPESVG